LTFSTNTHEENPLFLVEEWCMLANQ